jgi:cell division protease FtsH
MTGRAPAARGGSSDAQRRTIDDDMADTPNSTPPKGRKTRSLGAFLLFLTVLVGVLLVLGGEPWQPSVQLTQDQFEWQLYRGNVDTLDMRGQNSVQGQLKTAIGPKEAKHFTVEFASIEGLEQRYQALKAVPGWSPITPDALLQAVEGGWYKPEEVRLLTAHRRDAAVEPEGEPAVAPGATPQEVLQVTVLASSRARWEAARASGEAALEEPPFELPASAGLLHLELSDTRDADTLVAALQARGASFERRDFDVRQKKGTQWSNSGSMLSQVFFIYGPFILVFLVILLILRQMRSQGGAGGVMNFGRSRAQLYSKEAHTNVTFDDVAGATEAKDEVREIVEFLKNPSRFTRIGGRIPRGVLLVGSPGCGKTLLAKAIAGEAEVPFFSISGSDFVEMFVGVGASRVRDLFKQARENSPCIIFLDEIDAVGRRRGSGMGGGHDEREQTLNAILVEMDGFGTDEGIIVVAATNRPDVLDPALLRPGRFDREVTIELPDVEGREEILRVHLKKVKSGPDVDLRVLARSTPGYSGADLAAIINEAAIRAALNKQDFLSMEDLEEARDKVRYGRQKKSRKLELADREITAYHEAGHAVVAASIEEIDYPHKVTIVPRGRALGATMTLPDKESYHMQRKRMLGQLALLFGGRVAEAEFCGDISAGASDDIARATELARAMVTELGMSERIGPINYAERQGSDFLGTELMRGRSHSEETAREIDREVQQLLTDAYARAESIVKTKRDAVLKLAQALLSYETVSGEEIKRLLSGTRIEDLRQGGPPQPIPVERRATSPVPAPRAAGDAKPEAAPGDLAGEAGLSPA